MKKQYLVAVTIAAGIYGCAPRVYRSQEPAPATQPAPTPEPAAPTPEPEKQPEAPPPPALVAQNVLSASEKAAGWQLLFDGKTSDGWHGYGSKTIGTAWKTDNGTLYLDNTKDGSSKSGGDIVTDKEYGNFELQIDWKIDKNGNSGICFYSHEDRERYQWMWNTAPEIQIVDNEGHPDGKIFKHQAGDLYDLIPAASHAEHPPLEWNHYLIRCVNGKLDVYLNDVHILDTQLWNENWRTLIAGSKFKNATDFGTYKKGRIGLQDHGNNVWFRNIKIRNL